MFRVLDVQKFINIIIQITYTAEKKRKYLKDGKIMGFRGVTQHIVNLCATYFLMKEPSDAMFIFATSCCLVCPRYYTTNINALTSFFV